MKRKIISIHPESLKANAVTEELAGRIAQWAMTMSSLICLLTSSFTYSANFYQTPTICYQCQPKDDFLGFYYLLPNTAPSNSRDDFSTQHQDLAPRLGFHLPQMSTCVSQFTSELIYLEFLPVATHLTEKLHTHDSQCQRHVRIIQRSRLLHRSTLL